MYGRVNEENMPGEHTISPTDGGKQESLVDVMHAFDSDEEANSAAAVPALPRVASCVERLTHDVSIDGRVNEESTPDGHKITPSAGRKEESFVDVTCAFAADEQPKAAAAVPALRRVPTCIERIAHHFPIVSPRSGVWNCPKTLAELDALFDSLMAPVAIHPDEAEDYGSHLRAEQEDERLWIMLDGEEREIDRDRDDYYQSLDPETWDFEEEEAERMQQLIYMASDPRAQDEEDEEMERRYRVMEAERCADAMAMLEAHAAGKEKAEPRSAAKPEREAKNDDDSSSDLDSKLSEQADDEDPDLLTIGVEKDKTWLTMEDAELRRIERLSTYLRKDPLLPLPPANSDKLLKLEGLNLPLVHCAFENCGWVSDSRPCLRCIPDDDTQATQVAAGMWRVLPGREQSGHGILGCCGRETCLKQHIVNCHSEALMESCGKAELQSFFQHEKRRGKGEGRWEGGNPDTCVGSSNY